MRRDRDRSKEDAKARRTLSRIARDSELGATWRDQVRALLEKEDKVPEDWLRLWRLGREFRVFPDDACFFGIVWSIEKGADVWIGALHRRDFAERYRALDEKHGLAEGEYFALDERPEDYQALDDEYDRASDQMLLELFQRHGEDEIAELYEHDRAEFDRRREAGRFYVFGPFSDAQTTEGGGQAK